MMRWKEQMKSALLNILVLLSFLLSSMLWNKQPQFEFISPTTYVTSNKIGQTQQIDDLVAPESIIFHYGGDKHTKANSTENDVYEMMQAQMAKWYFYDFLYFPLSREKWEALTHDKIGFEIQYRSPIPVSVMSQLFAFRDEMNDDIEGIDRVWLYYEEKEDIVYALFISNKDKQIIRARTVVNPKELKDLYLPLGKQLPEQVLKVHEKFLDPLRSSRFVTFWNVYYVPKNSVRMKQYNYYYLPITEQQLIEAFFLDPTLVRQVVERDDTTIYTDGSRSIQVRPNQQMMTFTNPALQEGDNNLTKDDKLRGVISFINAHLGWTDDYRLERIDKRNGDSEQFIFRQYLESYPVIRDSQGIDVMRVVTENGHVVSLKRSLIDLDKDFYEKDWAIKSGHELFEYLRDNLKIDVDNIQNVYLAYQVSPQKGYVELMPCWVIEREAKEAMIIDARSMYQGGDLENGLE